MVGAFVLTFSSLASAKVANTPQSIMHLGRIWVHPEYDGAEGWGGSAPIYPAGIPTLPDGENSVKRGFLGQVTKLATYLTATDWTSPLGTAIEYSSSYCFRSMDYAYYRVYVTETGNYNFPVRGQEIFRWARPTIVAGDSTLKFFPGPGAALYPDNSGVGPRPDPIVDPDLVTEEAIDVVWRFSQGAEYTRRQYGYGFGTAHQDYILWDAVLVNNGKSYGDTVLADPAPFTLTNQVLHKVIYGQGMDYTNTQAPTAASQPGMDNEGKYIQPWGATGQSVTLFYDLDSQHAAAPGPDWGDPIETAAMEGHLAGNAYLALGPVFTSKGPGALFDTNDLDQPAFRTFQQMRGLDFAGGSYPANSQELREFLVDGALQMPIDQSFRTYAQTQALADDANGATAILGYGPLGGDKTLSIANVKAHGWDLAWMDSVRIVQVMAGGGIDAYEGQRIGQAWNAAKGAAAAADTWMSLADQALVQTGMDTVSKALALAYWNFNGTFASNVTTGMKTAWGIPTYVASKPSIYNQPFNVPDAPRPPAYFSVKALGQGGILVRWTRESEADVDFDTKVADFAGYRVYRWEASRLGKPVVVKEGPASDFWAVPADPAGGAAGRPEGPAGLAFLDKNVTTGTDYWYAVTAYDDGTQNWAEPGKALESAYFWCWTGFTSKGVTAPTLDGVGVTVARADRFALEQNAPNPFNPSTTIRFAVPANGNVRLTVFDVNGRIVRTLVDGNATAGNHEVVWDGLDMSGRSVASGVYIYRLTGANNEITRRMTLVR
jgi:hypothetical protein